MEIIADENAIHFKTSAKIRTTSALAKFLLSAAVVLLVCALTARAAVSDGSISGTLKDPTGALIPDATIILVNTALRSQYKTASNGQGFYSFPTLTVGDYALTIEAAGFKTQTKTNLTVDADAALRVDAVLTLGQQSDSVTVEATATATETQVDTVSTHLGELVSGQQMTALPLNGRSYTDLLPIQPGVAPVSTLLPNSVIMAGVTGGLSPSGDLNPGNLWAAGVGEWVPGGRN